MQSIKAWGLGQSFSTPTDMVLGSLCLLLFAILFRMAYLVVRPSCAVQTSAALTTYRQRH
jgi:hypothetical protein